MGLNSDNLTKVFVLIFSVFLPDFMFCTSGTDLPKFHQNCACVQSIHRHITSHFPYNQNVHCVVSNNNHYQGNGFAVGVGACDADHHRQFKNLHISSHVTVTEF